MAENTYRPERRPISASETMSPDEVNNRFDEMADIRNRASAERAEGEPAVDFKGNLPPAMQRILQSQRDNDAEERGVTNGPRSRNAPEKTPSKSGSDRLTELMTKVRQKTTDIFDKIELPSKGKFYDGTDGPRDGILHVRRMTGEEEQILATPRFVRQGKAINMIFNKCIQEDFQTENLLTPDRTYLLIFLRGISYTPEYDVEVKCPHCERKFNYTIDLNQLHVDQCPDDYNPEDLEDTLPTTGFKFTYRLSTGADEQRVQDYRERKMKFDDSGMGDDTLHYRNALMIKDIEGLSDKNEIQKLLRVLPINDVAYLRSRINEPPFGVDTKVEIPCGNCSQDFEIDLPLEANFFFPRAKKKAQTQA